MFANGRITWQDDIINPTISMYISTQLPSLKTIFVFPCDYVSNMLKGEKCKKGILYNFIYIFYI